MKWKLRDSNPLLVSLYKKVFEQNNLSSIMARILLGRNLDIETSMKLINDPMSLIENPHDITGAEDVAVEIIKNLKQNKLFYVYADYDIDGMTSGYIITEYLRSLDAEVEVIFPQRSDGYGLNMDFCRKIVSERKNCVVLTVDNGITKVNEIQYLADNGISTIVTDHHEPKENLPNCVICDPFTDENSAGHHLCGAGVIWKIICLIDEILHKQKFNFFEYYLSPEAYIPYVALGTIGDIMPYTLENLAIMRIGLYKLKHNEVRAVYELFKSGVLGSSRINIKNINFGLNSMMNACSRMGKIEKACNLFFLEEADENEIYLYGQEMKKLNEQRKTESKKATEYVLNKCPFKTDKDKIILADIGDFKPGLSGLVATNLARKFNLPTCIYKENLHDDLVTASIRSIPGVNILEYLEIEKCKGVIESYGGHAVSCGVQMRRSNISTFNSDMNELLKDLEYVKPGEDVIQIDAVVHCGDLNQKLRDEIDMLPYSENEFKSPVLCLKNVDVTANLKSKDHIQYFFSDDTGILNTVEWHGYSRYEDIGCPRKVDLVFCLEDFGIQCYGKHSDDLNLRILDIRPSAVNYQ